MPLEQLTITTETTEKGVTIVCLSGQLDSHTFDNLQQAFTDLFDKGVYKLILDFSALTYMSSAGAGVLIGAMTQATNNSGGMVLASVAPPVLEVFAELGLADIFQITEDRAAALALF